MSEEMTNTSATKILDALSKLLTKGFVSKHKATLTVASDPAHALDILSATKQGACSIVLFYTDDTAAGEEDLEGDTFVEGTIRAAVVQYPSMSPNAQTNAPTVLALAEALRTFITKAVIDGVLGGMSYSGMAHLSTYAGEILHGYAVSYKVGYAFEID